MNSKQRKTLAAIFAEPVSASIAWSEVESLLRSVGCEAVEGSGSRVKFNKAGMIVSFHRPHPEPHAKRYQVREAREYLIRLGVEP